MQFVCDDWLPGTCFAAAALGLKMAGFAGPMTFARALVLVTRDSRSLDGVTTLYFSIKNSKHVFVLFAFVVVFFAIVSMFLFEDIMPTLCNNFQDSELCDLAYELTEFAHRSGVFLRLHCNW